MHKLPENIVNLSAASTDTVPLTESMAGNCTLEVLRLDKIDPVISGNKWFKLKYYLEQALAKGQNSVLSFGGAWSNHIVATAFAARKAGLQSIGIIRGERPADFSPSLQKAAGAGMQLVFVSREAYNQKNDPAFIKQLEDKYHHPCIIPEGGAGEPGIKGATEITRLMKPGHYTHLLCAVGTGTLLAGLVQGTTRNHQVIGIPVLKGFDNWLPPGIAETNRQRVKVLTGYHMGGYAKKNEQLFEFMNRFYFKTHIPTDFVYTGKLFFSIFDLLKKNYFPAASRLLAIHSGGLQGNDSLPPKTLVF
ncbi:MAG: pyridoxal-phosphate dependent enzyme [Bacteroidota bacterium]